MPAPETVQEYLTLVRQSALVTEATLDAYLREHQAEFTLAPTPGAAARLFVRDAVLTPFQAELLSQGKWRRFTIGRYKVLEQIGSGGFGTVYLCEHMHMRRKVAVKVLPVGRAVNPGIRERFYREARAVAALDHPNIVRAYDVGQDENLHFLAMEYVDGNSLQEIVKRRGTLTPLQAVYYMRQVAQGLQHAHESGLVHRDIKPSNLLVDMTGTIKILDLGLARFCEDETDDLSIRNAESVLGTVDYLSPEQAVSSHDVDIRTDIYSLGATIYFCLTGAALYPNASPAQKLIWLQSRKPQAIATYRDDVPRSLIKLIEKTMARNPSHRYQSPRELLRALNELPILAGETHAGSGDRTRTKPDQWRPKERKFDRQRWWIAGAVGVVLLLSLLAVMVFVAMGR